jgi:uncharacterized protein (DUF2236 family)
MREVFVIPEQLKAFQAAHEGARLALDSSVAVRFGPQSEFRTDLCDMRNFFTIWSAGLLQLAHPVIGDAVHSQSRFFGSAWERLDSSARGIAQIVTGDNAAVAGHRVRDYHRRVFGRDENGRQVSALHPEPYTWGWATILRMIEEKKRRFEAPATDQQWENWYQEGRVAYQCQGVSDRLLPTNYQDYRSYLDTMGQTRLRRTEALDRALEQLDNGAVDRPPQLPPILWNRATQVALSKYVRIMAIGGLPETVREELSIPWEKTDQRALTWLDRTVKTFWPCMPKRLTYHPSTVRDILPPKFLHQKLLCQFGEFVANLAFKDK